MYSHLGSGGRIFLIDINKKLIGTSDDAGVTLKGFTLDQFMPEKVQFGDGSTPSLSPIYYTLANNEELDINGVQLRFNTQLLAIKALTNVRLAQVGSLTSTTFTVSVKSVLDNVGVRGLVTVDFIETMGGGAITWVDNGDGTYTATGTSLTTGTVALRAADLLTVKAYEGINTLTVA